MMPLFAAFLYESEFTVVGHEPLIPMWKLFRPVSSLLPMLTRKSRELVVETKIKMERKREQTISVDKI